MHAGLEPCRSPVISDDRSESVYAHRICHPSFADTHQFRYVQQSGRMTRLYAAAHFKFAIELKHLAVKLTADREQATAAFTTTIVVSTVIDRDAAVVRARSDFSIVTAKSVKSVSCFVFIDRIAALEFRWVNSLLSRHLARNQDFGLQIQNRFRPFLAYKLSQGSALKTSDSRFNVPDQRKRGNRFVKVETGGFTIIAECAILQPRLCRPDQVRHRCRNIANLEHSS